MAEKLIGHPDTHPLPENPEERKRMQEKLDKAEQEALERYRARKAKEEAEKGTSQAVDKTVNK